MLKKFMDNDSIEYEEDNDSDSGYDYMNEEPIDDDDYENDDYYELDDNHDIDCD